MIDFGSIFDIDKKLNNDCFKNKRNGFYIEAGANNGIEQSNTVFFERYLDWKGILIEPLPNLYNQLISNRSANNIFQNCALVSRDYKQKEISIVETPHCRGLMSVINGTEHTEARLKKEGSGNYNYLNVPAKTLNEILEENRKKLPPVIDFLSLDVETYELEVLKGLDLERWNIAWIVAEELDDRDSSLRDYLKELYHIRYKLSENDVLFMRK